MSTVADYSEFLHAKSHLNTRDGFEPIWMPDSLFDFQASMVEWALRQGRAALFEDCGLGKTLQELVWGENVVRKTNGRVLHGTRNSGERHGKAKLSEALILAIRKGLGSDRAVAAAYGVSRWTIRAARTGRTWSHL